MVESVQWLEGTPRQPACLPSSLLAHQPCMGAPHWTPSFLQQAQSDLVRSNQQGHPVLVWVNSPYRSAWPSGVVSRCSWWQASFTFFLLHLANLPIKLPLSSTSVAHQLVCG